MLYRMYGYQAGEEADEDEELWDLEHRDPKVLGKFDLVSQQQYIRTASSLSRTCGTAVSFVSCLPTAQQQ